MAKQTKKQAKMGRPPLPLERRKGVNVALRLTPGEAEYVACESRRLKIPKCEVIMRLVREQMKGG